MSENNLKTLSKLIAFCSENKIDVNIALETYHIFSHKAQRLATVYNLEENEKLSLDMMRDWVDLKLKELNK